MATRKCPHCYEKIQAKASVCKHCRASVEPIKSMGFLGMVGLAGMSGLVFVTVLGLVVSRGSPAGSSATADQHQTEPSQSEPSQSQPRRQSLLLQAVSAVKAPRAVESAPSAACRAWFDHRPNLGNALTVEDLPDWACGPRRSVETDSGSYLCYLKADRVVTIWKMTGEQKIEVFRAPNSLCPP